MLQRARVETQRPNENNPILTPSYARAHLEVVDAGNLTISGFDNGCLALAHGRDVLIGARGCDIEITPGHRFRRNPVEQRHAILQQIGDDFYISDLGSRTGTYLNGIKVDQRRKLAPDDTIAIAGARLRFRGPSRDAAVAAVFIDGAESRQESPSFRHRVSAGKTALLQNPEAKLGALVEVLQNLGPTLEIDSALGKVLTSLFKIFPAADRGIVIMKDSRGHLVPRAFQYRRGEGDDQARISRTVVQHVLARKEAILSDDAAHDDRFLAAESIASIRITSLMCAPLLNSQNEAAGALLLDRTSAGMTFQEEDLGLFASVASQVGILLEHTELAEAAVRGAKMAGELELAANIQASILKPPPADVPGYQFFSGFRPALQLAGDFYAHVPLPDGRIAALLGDVSGKGAPAGLVSANLAAAAPLALLLCAPRPDGSAALPTPAEGMRRFNDIVNGMGVAERFVTMALFVLDPATHQVTIVNAGHMPPLLCRASGEVVEVGNNSISFALGWVPSESLDLEECIVELQPGDTLLTFSDGIPDARNVHEEAFGNDRILQHLRGLMPASPEAIVQSLLAAVEEYSKGTKQRADDICITAIGRTYE